MVSILIVHSAREVLRVLAGILRRHGYSALTATDGEQALRLFAGDPTDVVLSDVHPGSLHNSTNPERISLRESSSRTSTFPRWMHFRKYGYS